MEKFSALLPVCEGNPPVTGRFPSQWPVTRFVVFFDLRMNKRLSKQSRSRWFETPLRSLWCHCNFFSRSRQTFWMTSSVSQIWHESTESLRNLEEYHDSDVIMDTMASQFTSLNSVYSTVYSDADRRKHRNSGDRWIPRTNGQWRGKCFQLMTSSWYVLFCCHRCACRRLGPCRRQDICRRSDYEFRSRILDPIKANERKLPDI